MGKRLICAFAAVILLVGMAFASPVRAAEIPDVTDYSYTVTPLLEPFCYYLYVQTDNPDPTSFRLVDDESILYESGDRGSISVDSGNGYAYFTEVDPGTYYCPRIRFPDVVYENADTYRVPGGYIFRAEDAFSDGGEFVLLQKTYSGSDILEDRFEKTDIRIPCQSLTTRVGYLIDTCTDETMTFFEKMDAVQARLNEIAVYPRSVYDTDSPNESRPYPLLAASPYPELDFNQHYDMYHVLSSGILTARTYPFVLDSLGVPGTMQSVAQEMEPECQVAGGATHALVDVTFEGETRTYGGAGAGGNDPLYSNRIRKVFTFQGTEDLGRNGTVEDYRDVLLGYQTVASEDLQKYQDLVGGTTFKKTIRETGGTWIRVATEGWGYGQSFGYAVPIGDAVLYVSEGWVDGRYINIHEILSTGAKFEDHPTADIVLQDVTYTDYYGKSHTQDVIYTYDAGKDAWIAPGFYENLWYGTYWPLPEELVLTREEVAAMELDGNSSHVPESGLVYDGLEYPGTPFQVTLVTGVQVPESVQIYVDEEYTLTAEVIPGDATYKSVTWTSSDPEVAEVWDARSGQIKGMAEGTAVLTAVTVDGAYQAQCLVTVVADPCAQGHAVLENGHTCGICGAEVSDCIDSDPRDHKCDICAADMGSHEAAEGEHICAYCGEKLSDCADEDGDGLCDVCGGAYAGEVVRIFGSDRYETAFRTVDTMMENQGILKYGTIVVACGTDFADALSGSYLANQKEAPILLVRNRTKEINAVKAYIRENLATGGTVYLLGGINAVPRAMEEGLGDCTVKRLAGATRYDTNLEILKEAGVGDKDVLVCTGKDFADGLSVSAVNKPILLVKDSLNAAQKGFLDALEGNRIYIIGGTNAVNTRIENALKTYGETSRIGGSNRYVTSVNIAKKFFPDARNIVLAYGQNFPDGLSGGPLAFSLDAPLILTANGKQAPAVAYAAEAGIDSGAILGGPGLIPDRVVRAVFDMTATDEIIIR